MKNELPYLKSKIEENIAELKYCENISELICVLENPSGGQIQVSLTLTKVNEEDEFQELIDIQESTPIIKINGGKILTPQPIGDNFNK